MANKSFYVSVANRPAYVVRGNKPYFFMRTVNSIQMHSVGSKQNFQF
jgi:hypothetical protein